MSLPLTVENVRLAYRYLAATEPFVRWNMPETDDVTFLIRKRRDLYGHYRRCRGFEREHEIMVSSVFIGTTRTLMELMAHEMIHLHMGSTRMDKGATIHNAAFRALADMVCRYHGFDPKTF